MAHRNGRRTGWYRGTRRARADERNAPWSRLPPERECVFETCSPPTVRMSPGARCVYILHPGMAAALRRRTSSDTTGQISGTERLSGAGKTARLGLRESRTSLRKGCTNKKPHSLLRGLCGSKAELTGNSRLYPLPPLANGESHQSPADQQQGNRLGHSDVKLPGKRTPNGSARIDDSFNLQGTFVVDLRRERTAPKREGANRIGDSPVCVQ